MALKVWLPLNGNPYMRNLGISGNIIPESAGTHHSFSSGGKLGYALTFIGAASDYLCIPGLKLQTFSWACWFKCTGSTTATSQRILSEGRDTGSRGAEIWISQDSTTLYLQAHGVTHTTTIEPDKWYHVAFTCGDGVFSSYLNGNLINSSAYTANCDYAQSNDKFVIGKMAYNYTNTSNYFPFVGRINDVRIYDHCLSAKEVKEISQGLILHYKLDGFSGGVGENILTGTNYNSYSSSLNATTATNASGKWCGGSGGNGTFSVIEDFTCPAGNLSWNISNNTSGNRDFQQGNQPYVSGQQYTTSFWAKGNGTCLYRSWNSTDGKQMFSKTWTLTSDWVYYTHTFTASAEMETDLCTFHLGVTGNSNISICGMKMEKGSIATAWSPAPQDLGIDTTKIIDSSGYGNDGVILNSVTTETNSPKYSFATHISSTSSKIEINNLITAGFGDSYSFAWWAKISSVTPMHWGFADGIRLNGMYTGRLWNTGDSSNNPLYIPNTTTQVTAPTVNTWHHWVMTGDGISCKVYQDGILWGVAKTYKSISGTQIYINGWNSTTQYSSDNFSISDFRIYATALSAEDILDLYHTSANIDNLGGIHGFEIVEDTSSRELLALPWTSAYSTHNKTSISTNYNDKHEWYSNTNSSAGSDYIKINPTGKTYYWDTEISVAAGNQFYIGFERYDANKTSRSNQACAYIIAIKPTSNIVHQRYFGTIDLSTDGVNPTDTIALRILNAWSGTTSDSTKEATIHYLSLREVSGKPQTGKIKQQGQIYTDEFVEREKQASIYENGFVGGNIIIEK